jgi:hypothetical protein
MRRPWLLAAAATVLVGSTACDPSPNEVPTEAEAPTPDPGRITFPSIARSAIDGIINRAECESPTATILLKAQISSAERFTEYKLYAANSIATEEPSVDPCQITSGNPVGLEVGQVGGERTESVQPPFITPQLEFSTSQMVTAAGATCGASEPIRLCIQATRGSGTNIGVARVTLPLVVDDAPDAPILESVTPGEEALNVQWDAPGAGVDDSYAVEVGTPDLADPLVVVTLVSPRVSGRSLRFEGLTIGSVYSVQVRAFSDADNPSDPSNAFTASPVDVRDYFEAYKDAGGREQGGCGTGGAGLLALAGLAALVPLRRRS